MRHHGEQLVGNRLLLACHAHGAHIVALRDTKNLDLLHQRPPGWIGSTCRRRATYPLRARGLAGYVTMGVDARRSGGRTARLLPCSWSAWHDEERAGRRAVR